MAKSPQLPEYLEERSLDFSGGANSFSDPSKLPPSQFYWAENAQSQRNEIGTRQGFTNLLKFSCGRAQGIHLFRPSNTSAPNLYMAISGEIWLSRYPFTTASRIPGIKFRPDVDFVTFETAIVANSPSAAVTPYLVLIMQDGITAPAYTDGLISRHLDPTPNGFYSPASLGAQETRIGLAMCFIGGRLWVANGRELFASDIFDPLHFIETTYLAGGGSFLAYDGDVITSLCRTADDKQLLVGTIGNTTAISAGNTDRASWGTDPNFERLLFPGVGWTGPKCSGEINAERFWMSKEGVRFYNSVGVAAFSARRPISSHEMDKSWVNRAPTLSRVCAGSLGAYGILGVPSGDQYNRHLWAIDTSSSDLLTQSLPYAWQGIWKGIRPVEFTSGMVNGENRMFCLEQGRDVPRVWELFAPKRRDYYRLGGLLMEQPIDGRFDSRGILFGQPQDFKQLAYSELHFKRIFGTATVNLQYKNEFGCYRDIGNWTYCTTECINLSNCVTTNPPEQQSRYARSHGTNATAACEEGGSPNRSNIGTFFTFRLNWRGEWALRSARYFATQWSEPTQGACSRGDTECINLACCDQELDYWSSPSEFFPYYYYTGDCHVLEVSAQ